MNYAEYKENRDRQYEEVAKNWNSNNLTHNLDKPIDKIVNVVFRSDILYITYSIDGLNPCYLMSEDDMKSDEICDYIRELYNNKSEFKDTIRFYLEHLIARNIKYSDVYANILDSIKLRQHKLCNLPKVVNEEKYKYSAGNGQYTFTDTCVYVPKKKFKHFNEVKKQSKDYTNMYNANKNLKSQYDNNLKRLNREFRYILLDD
jgi:hypothetical protein